MKKGRTTASVRKVTRTSVPKDQRGKKYVLRQGCDDTCIFKFIQTCLCYQYNRYLITQLGMDPRKLCHISDLPNNLHFLPIEIKHLLPVHQSKFADNLHTIIANEAHSHRWPVYPDPKLSLSNPHYVVLSGGWCEDIDGQSEHLKSSLQLSAIILNYLSSLLEAPTPDQQFSPPQTINRVDHIGYDPSPTAPRFPFVYAYNIYKTKDKQSKKRFIFIVGYHRSSHLRLYSLINTVRDWNFHRFKSDTCMELSANRLHKSIEHMLIILRSFLPLDEDDHLGKQRELQILVEEIDAQSMPKEIPRDGIDQSHQVVLSRFQWTYKGIIKQIDMAIFIAEILTQLLKIMPLNTACSFAGKSIHEPKLNQLVIIWMTAFKKSKSHTLTNDNSLQVVAHTGTAFMRKKITEVIKDNSTTIADQMIKSSLKVLNRYAPGTQRTNVKDWGNQSQISQGAQNSLRSYNSSVIEEKPRNPDFDRMSVISRISFKDNQLSRDNRARVDAQFQSLSSPLMAHRDQQYAQLLNLVTKWKSLNGSIPTWPELHQKLCRNCEVAKQRYSNTKINQSQSELLLSMAALKRYLQMDEFFMLIKYHSQHREALFEVLFQGSQGSFLQNLGIKMAKEYARPLYDSYITKQFIIDPNNPLPTFVKRLVTLFANELKLQEIGDRVSMPLLLELLEHHNTTGQSYRLLAREAMSDIFTPNKALMIISPILYEIYTALAEDHHEELVNGLIADLAFETVYFSFDHGKINNSPYCKGKDLKQKKLLQLLRQGGFNSLGFEARNILRPIIFEYSNYYLPSSRIYSEIVISRPLQLSRFVELIINSTFTQHFSEITNYFRQVQHTADTVTRPIANAYLQTEVTAFQWEKEEDMVSGVLKSQSGIFRHLMEYNPQIKLAGRPLSQVLKNRQSQKPVSPQRFDAQYIISTVFKQKLQQIYQYILIVSNVKQKYDVYESLKEDERIYLREIVHQVLCRRSDIVEYLELCFLAKQFSEMEVPFLF